MYFFPSSHHSQVDLKLFCWVWQFSQSSFMCWMYSLSIQYLVTFRCFKICGFHFYYYRLKLIREGIYFVAHFNTHSQVSTCVRRLIKSSCDSQKPLLTVLLYLLPSVLLKSPKGIKLFFGKSFHTKIF